MSDPQDMQDVYGSLGDVTDCATCQREAAGERLQVLEHPDGGNRVWRVHLCRYCNRAFNLGNGKAPMMGGVDAE